ncbi:Proteasome subunit alpha [Candidatus Lokiarchaeum ossiferum]|uniref:Proteasome subunit alpha n=1 Tax=Candidatus Lokiarchaeum ossiferum TaxID=2951803 RepID=A0ABY6HQ41_9ARCH|nr:Proteasome subunit alpha [Candidatus Lokiarchaeum sp. B-35]
MYYRWIYNYKNFEYVKNMPELRIIIPENMEKTLDSLIRAGIAGNKAEIVRSAITQYLSSVPTAWSKDYDLESVFSPDGRILQVEYATIASEKGLLSLGIQTKNGLVLLKRKSPACHPDLSALRYNEYTRPLQKLSKKIEISMTGIMADGKLVMKKAKEIMNQNTKNESVDIYALVEDLSFFLHKFTLNKDLRVLGACFIIGGFDLTNRPKLFLLDPSGSIHETRVVAIGNEREKITKEILTKFSDEMSLDESIQLAIRSTVVDNDDLENIIVDTIDGKTGNFKELNLEEKMAFLRS